MFREWIYDSFLQAHCTSRCKASMQTNALRGSGKRGGRVRGHIFIEVEKCIVSSMPDVECPTFDLPLSLPKISVAVKRSRSNKHQNKPSALSESISTSEKLLETACEWANKASKDRSSCTFNFTRTSKTNFQQKELLVTSENWKISINYSATESKQGLGSDTLSNAYLLSLWNSFCQHYLVHHEQLGPCRSRKSFPILRSRIAPSSILQWHLKTIHLAATNATGSSLYWNSARNPWNSREVRLLRATEFTMLTCY